MKGIASMAEEFDGVYRAGPLKEGSRSARGAGKMNWTLKTIEKGERPALRPMSSLGPPGRI
jgi:hypothetical protein